jgi:LysM repeat protein
VVHRSVIVTIKQLNARLSAERNVLRSLKMKPFVLALVAAVLAAAQILSPVSAAPAAAAACGDTYTVQKGDYLSKIAANCGVTLTTLINANPEIKNISLIYPGQVIRIKNDTTIPVTGGTYVVKTRDTLFLIAVRYGTTVDALLKLNPAITDRNKIYVGQVIKVPGSGTGVPVTGSRVTLSATSAKAGTQVTVNVAGFPANAFIDYRLGKQGAAFSVVYDGKTDAAGAASFKVTLPASAVTGEKWVVIVLTTEIAKTTSAVSPVITVAAP